MLFSSVADCDKRLPVQNKQKKQVLEICCLILLYRTITEQWPQNQSNAPNHDSSVPLHSTGYQDLYGKISCNWYLFVRYVKGKTWHFQKKIHIYFGPWASPLFFKYEIRLLLSGALFLL